jgi:thiol-disulfide isomerase/thioredoxin
MTTLTLRRRAASRRLPAFAAVLLAVVLLASLPAVAQPGGGNLPALSGPALNASDLGSGTTVLVVWASWYPRCRDIVDRVNALEGRWGSRVRVVTVNFQEDRPTINRFLNGQSLRVPVYLDADGSFSKRHAVTELPGLVVIRDGKTLYKGRFPDDPDRLLERLVG